MKKIVSLLLCLLICLSSLTFAEDTWTCPNCGKENTKNFCTSCGTPRPENTGFSGTPFTEPVSAASYKVGDTVTFGSWGDEPVEWQILERKEDGTYVMISVMGLDAKAYNEDWEAATWETCSLRAWLNGEFYETAFTAEERAKIRLSTVENEDNQTHGTSGGNATKDYVYLLSVEEADRYYRITGTYGGESAALICMPTKTAIRNECWEVSQDWIRTNQWNYGYTLKAGACWWWLRTPGESEYTATYVGYDGNVGVNGLYNFYTDACVRPVICVNL